MERTEGLTLIDAVRALSGRAGRRANAVVSCEGRTFALRDLQPRWIGERAVSFRSVMTLAERKGTFQAVDVLDKR